jgi:hypothetical protein
LNLIIFTAGIAEFHSESACDSARYSTGNHSVKHRFSRAAMQQKQR